MMSWWRSHHSPSGCGKSHSSETYRLLRRASDRQKACAHQRQKFIDTIACSWYLSWAVDNSDLSIVGGDDPTISGTSNAVAVDDRRQGRKACQEPC
jgi:hypothetical protein